MPDIDRAARLAWEEGLQIEAAKYFSDELIEDSARQNLKDWYSRWRWVERVMHGG